MNAPIRWPRLMSEDDAAAYLSISATTFRAIGLASKSIGRRVLYDQRDLDRYVDRLDGKPVPVEDAADAAAEEERRFFQQRERRRAGN